MGTDHIQIDPAEKVSKLRSSIGPSRNLKRISGRSDNKVSRIDPSKTDTMRAKRSKKYRKLMHQYELTFGFHEPYQVLGTSTIEDSAEGVGS